MPRGKKVQDDARYVLTDKAKQAMGVNSWGGARPGAGRPRTETLSSPELRFLVALVEDSAFSAEYADLVGKMQRMAEKMDAGR